MTSTVEYERRINAALEALSRGISALPAVLGDADARNDALMAATRRIAVLESELAQARAGGSDAEHRLATLHARQETIVAILQRRVETLTAHLDTANAGIESLRSSCDQLRGVTRRLTAEAGAGLSDPALIDAAKDAELEALRADRAAEAAQIDQILTGLDQIIGEKHSA